MENADKPNESSQPKAPPPNGASRVPGIYATFTHYITGKVYYAKDYGYDGWPIGRK